MAAWKDVRVIKVVRRKVFLASKREEPATTIVVIPISLQRRESKDGPLWRWKEKYDRNGGDASKPCLSEADAVRDAMIL